MKSIGTVDLIMILIYVVGFAVVAASFARKIKSAKDFTSAGQGLSLVQVIGSTVATCMGASIVFGNYELVVANGISGMVATLFWFVGWCGLILISRQLRRSGATTFPGFLEKQYNGSTRKIAAYVMLISAISSTAAQFMAFGKMTSALGICNATTGAMAGAVIITIFAIFGGKMGSSFTDTIQSVLILLAVAIAIPFAVFHEAGGVSDVFSRVDPDMLDITKGLTPMLLLSYSLSNFMQVSVQSGYSINIFTAKNEKVAFRGQLISMIVCLVVNLISVAPAFAAKFIYPDLTDGGTFVVRFISDYFPPVVKGITMGALLGLLITSGNAFLGLLSSTVTQDIIMPRHPDMEDRKIILYGRISMVIGAVAITAMAIYVKSVYSLFRLGGAAYGAAMFFPVMLSLTWKKVHPKAANLAMIVGAGSSFLLDLTKIIPVGGIIVGAILCLLICVFGTFYFNKTQPVASK